MRHVVALVGLAAVLLTGCSGSDETSVTTAEVGRGTVVEIVEAAATVAARASATLTAPTDAIVAELLVRDGQAVRAGQVVARLDAPDAQRRLREAEQADAQARATGVRAPAADLSGVQQQVDAAATAAFAAARAAAATTQDPAARARAEQAVTDAEQQYARTRAQALAAAEQARQGAESVAAALDALTAAQRAQTSAAVALARRTVEALVVTAPLGGVVTLGGGPAAAGGGGLDDLVGSLPEGLQGQAEAALGGGSSAGADVTSTTVSVGAALASGAPIATITDVSALTLVAEVDETDVLRVRPGVGARVEVDAVPGAQYLARVTAVDVAPTSSSGGGVAYRVRLDLAAGTTADGEPAPRPRPGMSAVADLEVRRSAEVVAVPVSAVVRDGGRDAVFVVDGSRAERRTVRLGAEGEDTVEVLDGLREGQRVVVRGADRLRDGQTVSS